MEILHLKRDQVLSYDTDVFQGDTPAELDHYLNTATATQIQNWLYIWKPFILSSIESAKDLSLHGVNHLTTYFPDLSKGPRRPRPQRSHPKAQPKLHDRPVLPQP